MKKRKFLQWINQIQHDLNQLSCHMQELKEKLDTLEIDGIQPLVLRHPPKPKNTAARKRIVRKLNEKIWK